MLNKDQIMNTQSQLFTTGLAVRPTMSTSAAQTNTAPQMIAKNGFSAPVVNPGLRAAKFQDMARQSVPMKMSMSQSSFKSSFAPAPALNAGSAARSRQFMMLAGNGPAQTPKGDHSRFMPPQMVASTPKTNSAFGFGASLQH